MSITDTFKTTPRSILKNLVQTLHDGQEGFREASEHVTNPQVKKIFSGYSLQRAKFAGELESELLTLGEEDPHKEGTSLSGKIHRGWIDLKSALTGHDEHAVLAEAERGEDAAVKAYEDALAEEELPLHLRTLIATQAREVHAAHDEVKALRDSAKAS